MRPRPPKQRLTGSCLISSTGGSGVYSHTLELHTGADTVLLTLAAHFVCLPAQTNPRNSLIQSTGLSGTCTTQLAGTINLLNTFSSTHAERCNGQEAPPLGSTGDDQCEWTEIHRGTIPHKSRTPSPGLVTSGIISPGLHRI